MVDYKTSGRTVQAVSRLSLDIAKAETLGLVGESGCGKSSAARAILQLPRPTAGSVALGGHELTKLQGDAMRRVRPRIQIVLQDPTSSLNPRRSIDSIVREGATIWKLPRAEADRRVDTALRSVGLDPEQVGDRKPHELSGGQRQRVSIARAVVLQPQLLILDEPLSSLDVSVQAQILELLRELKVRYDLSLLMISHDLAVVKNISDRIAVMYLGKLCEIGPADDVFQAPAHPYTLGLVSSLPDSGQAGGTHSPIGNAEFAEPPSPVDPPSGCRYRTRCPRATDVCAADEPQIREVAPGRFVACHFPLIEQLGPTPDQASPIGGPPDGRSISEPVHAPDSGA